MTLKAILGIQKVQIYGYTHIKEVWPPLNFKSEKYEISRVLELKRLGYSKKLDWSEIYKQGQNWQSEISMSLKIR